MKTTCRQMQMVTEVPQDDVDNNDDHIPDPVTTRYGRIVQRPRHLDIYEQ